MTNNEIIVEIINRKDDIEFMDMISNITFPFTSKYKSFKKPIEKKSFAYDDVLDKEFGK